MEKESLQKIQDGFYINKSQELGKGNFGKVYKGYSEKEGKIIAVKFMSKEVLKQNPGYQRQLVVMDQLRKIRHPNIMDYYGSKQKPQGLYVYLELCAGGSLKSLLSKEEKISQLKVMKLFKQLLQAMVYINSLKKVHRDLKPDNILLDENQEAKIADFGLARDIDTKMTKGTGTPLYSAPEVLNQQLYNEKCDVWSLGLILFEMLTGKELFRHVKTKPQLKAQVAQFDNPNKQIKYPKKLHPQWQKITRKMLTFYHTKRPSFQQVLSYFQSVEKQMVEDFNKKYDYSTPGFQDFDDGLKLTKSKSPYQVQEKKKGATQKFQQQRSYTNFVNLRKYLAFYRLKSDIMIRLVKEFTNNTYGCMKNVYKYLLMFLSLSACICRISHHLKQIKDQKVGTPDGQISMNDFNKEHLPQVKQLLEEFASKHTIALQKFQGVLEKQINAKILGNYLKRDQQKGIIAKVSQKTTDLVKMIQNSNKKIFQTEIDYMTIYKYIMNLEDVHISSDDEKNSPLLEMSMGDLKTYAYIRIIGNIDDIFLNGSYKQEDYLRIKKENIENKDQLQLFKFIRQYNSKN